MDRPGKKARTWGDDVAIAKTMLLGSKEPECLNQVGMFFRASHRYLK